LELVVKRDADHPSPDPDELVPLSAPVFHILASLSDSEAHGYGIIADIRSRTHGEVHLSTSTLYGAIKRMLRDRLIEESEMRPAPELDDQRRRYYRISAFGRRVLTLEARRIERLAKIVRAKRLLSNRVTE
jgi:DNA-binding PadR family transcriptional regulator